MQVDLRDKVAGVTELELKSLYAENPEVGSWWLVTAVSEMQWCRCLCG
jgi:hypothetical protein